MTPERLVLRLIFVAVMLLALVAALAFVLIGPVK